MGPFLQMDGCVFSERVDVPSVFGTMSEAECLDVYAIAQDNSIIIYLHFISYGTTHTYRSLKVE